MSEMPDPDKAVLDEEEKWYEDHFDEFVPAADEVRESLITAASAPPRIQSEKKQMVSIRLDPSDVKKIKEKAERAGLAYQTMISSLLHQYAEGDLVNIEEARKILKKT
ncbi:MAG: BrnA antitoxin family protein [Treponema sp.]|nr:BrnA antitoxin family protein [Treponema sp.]